MQSEFWEECLVDLQTSFDEQQFNTWVRPLQAVTENNTLKIFAPNPYAADWANKNLSEYLTKKLENSKYSFYFEVGGISQKIEEDTPVIQENKKDSFKEEVKFSSDFSFDNFVVGL